MDRVKQLLNTESVKDGRSKLGKSAADRLAGLTPEQLAQIEKAAGKLTPTQLQGVLTKAFANLDPATLSQMAEKFAASGAAVPGSKRTDPATLAVLASTIMKGRIGGIASLLMILAGSSFTNHARNMATGQPSTPGMAAARKSVTDLFASVTSRGTNPGVATAASRSRMGLAQLQDMVALARSPLARKVMSQVGPALLKMTNKGVKTPP